MDLCSPHAKGGDLDPTTRPSNLQLDIDKDITFARVRIQGTHIASTRLTVSRAYLCGSTTRSSPSPPARRRVVAPRTGSIRYHYHLAVASQDSRDILAERKPLILADTVTTQCHSSKETMPSN
ncbi:hypothetical protein CDL15_Pgr011687 [Punica granatum]|uniref:Uncharacterized protein n=1 Tax=Punica granatum TaxID=22663 RepID=A0A218WY39_PUNGR|nr:hypothetical protein CDL15_Pgr011687 [Punica granatum]PKI61882.1 hypothetical protein CRG98_017711 [Punica granatum]